MEDFTIRKGSPEDVEAVMEIYDSARNFMRKNGNLTQWINGYPSRELVLKDIREGNNYVCADKNNKIVMTFAFILGNDPTYDVIEGRGWLNDLPYGTIHRIGSNGEYGGMLRRCIGFCLSKVDNLRLDTHADNLPMQTATERLGFKKCGVIICQDGTPRIAYHLCKTTDVCK